MSKDVLNHHPTGSIGPDWNLQTDLTLIPTHPQKHSPTRPKLDFNVEGFTDGIQLTPAMLIFLAGLEIATLPGCNDPTAPTSPAPGSSNGEIPRLVIDQEIDDELVGQLESLGFVPVSISDQLSTPIPPTEVPHPQGHPGDEDKTQVMIHSDFIDSDTGQINPELMREEFLLVAGIAALDPIPGDEVVVLGVLFIGGVGYSLYRVGQNLANSPLPAQLSQHTITTLDSIRNGSFLHTIQSAPSLFTAGKIDGVEVEVGNPESAAELDWEAIDSALPAPLGLLRDLTSQGIDPLDIDLEFSSNPDMPYKITIHAHEDTNVTAILAALAQNNQSLPQTTGTIASEIVFSTSRGLDMGEVVQRIYSQEPWIDAEGNKVYEYLTVDPLGGEGEEFIVEDLENGITHTLMVKWKVVETPTGQKSGFVEVFNPGHADEHLMWARVEDGFLNMNLRTNSQKSGRNPTMYAGRFLRSVYQEIFGPNSIHTIKCKWHSSSTNFELFDAYYRAALENNIPEQEAEVFGAQNSWTIQQLLALISEPTTITVDMDRYPDVVEAELSKN